MRLWDFFFYYCGKSTNDFEPVLYKRLLLTAGLACLLTVSWLKPLDSHPSIMVHPCGRGHTRQLSPSLQIKSMSYPSWASCLQGSFVCTRTLWGNHQLSMAWTLSLSVCVRVCAPVCIQTNRIRRRPHPPWELSIWFYMFSDKVRRL